ncbi:hypothetical protein QJS66_10785 [Kocuria rhizophila]|nr:hypothetical protein QJS66_10785 [Kocuria rhizophila]
MTSACSGASLLLNWWSVPRRRLPSPGSSCPTSRSTGTGLIIVGLARCIADGHHLERPRVR